VSDASLEPRVQPKELDLLIVGGGPAGLCAAVEAAPSGVDILVVDDGPRFGGQLVKQTHKFFGSRLQSAGTRGFVIGDELHAELTERDNVTLWGDSTVLGLYPDGTASVEHDDAYWKFKPRAVIVAAGAGEKALVFPGADLPGVYGAGAVQTLMNVHGVLPAERLLMVGAGNIGLIVSYQLLQAGCDVVAIVEGLPLYGGYQVHASKVRRAGVPILTEHSIVRALGEDRVEGAVIARLENWNPVPGTERTLECDAICLAVGLSPQNTLLRMTGAEHAHIAELGGWVARRNDRGETSVPGLYVAGDCGGIEEASSAMIGGRIAGLDAAHHLGALDETSFTERLAELQDELAVLRSGPVGEHIRVGMARAVVL
jgi:sarcosine oxidase, subunit alpha